MTKQVDFKRYAEFVDAVTSDESKDFVALSARLVALDEKGANIERLATGAIGLCSEGGEIMEIVKKLVFQGKPFDEETVFHLKRELGDVLWYYTQCLIALNVSIEEVVEMNVAKLVKRSHDGEFAPSYSESRQEGDL